jgi:hypothetical protein
MSTFEKANPIFEYTTTLVGVCVAQWEEVVPRTHTTFHPFPRWRSCCPPLIPPIYFFIFLFFIFFSLCFFPLSQVVGSRWWDQKKGVLGLCVLPFHLHKTSSFYNIFERRRATTNMTFYKHCLHAFGFSTQKKKACVSLRMKKAYLINSYFSFSHLFTNGGVLLWGEGQGGVV